MNSESKTSKSLIKFIHDRLMTPLAKMAEEKHIIAVRKGILWSFPFFFIAALIVFFVVKEGTLMQRGFVAFLDGIAVLAICSSFMIAFRLSRQFALNAYLSGTLSALLFLFSIPMTSYYDTTILKFIGSIDGTSLFISIFLALLVVESQRLIRFLLRKTKAVIFKGNLFSFFMVAIFLSPVFWFLPNQWNFDLLLVVKDFIHPFITAGDTLAAAIILVLLNAFLWLAGVPGPAVISPIMTPIWLSLLQRNMEAVAAGAAPQHIVSIPFFMGWINIGGSGSILGLTLLMLRSKYKKARNIARVAFLPGLIGMNEPVIYAIPIVMNPIFAIPFLLTPVVLATLTYSLMRLGVVSIPYLLIPPGVPTFLVPYLSTGGDLRGVALHFVNIVISCAIYYPFYKSYEKQALAKEVKE